MDDDDAGRKAGFNLAKRAYSQGFEVFMMQAPKEPTLMIFSIFQGK